MRGHPTKFQLKEKPLHTKIILSNNWPAQFLYTSRKIQSFRVHCHFSSSGFSHASTVRCGTMRAAPPRCPECRTRTWLVPGGFCGGHATRSGQQWQHQHCNAVPRRPFLPSPTRGSCMPAQPRYTVAVARQALGALSAADGPAPSHSDKTCPKLLILVR